jgi:hypothetical protein
MVLTPLDRSDNQVGTGIVGSEPSTEFTKPLKTLMSASVIIAQAT